MDRRGVTWMGQMVNHSARGWRKLIGRATRDRRGNVAPMFAVLALPLIVAAGASVDVARTLDARAQMQDLADSAVLAGAYQYTNIGSTSAPNAQAAAEKYVKAMAPSLPNHPSVVTELTAVQGAASCNLPAPATPAVGTVSFQVCTTGAVAPDYIGQVQVTIAYNVKTTIGAIVRPSIPTNVISTAQGGVARQVTVSVANFNSDAADLNQIYYYAAPTDSNGDLLTGGPLYKFDPSTTASTPSGNVSAIAAGQCPMLSNKPTTACPNPTGTSISFQVPYGSRPAFALYNTTGGVSGYGANGYGQAQGALKKYFSTRAYVPPSAPTTTAYYDYQSGTFKYGANGGGDTTGILVADTPTNDSYTSLATCDIVTTTTTTKYNNGAKTVTTTTTTTGSSPTSSTKTTGNPGNSSVSSTTTQSTTAACSNTNTYSVGDYIFPWGHPRNPLQFGNLNRSSNGMPSGGTTDGLTTSDCALGSVTYDWDDGGGATDDNDFNDAVFTVNCQTTGVLNTSVRLIK